MSIWCTKDFLLSCDVDLDLKIFVGTLQLRDAVSVSPNHVECYLSAQVVDGGIPLHPFSRSTGLSYLSGSTLVWNEWLSLPVKIKDLTDTCQVIVKLWAVGNECIAGASIRCYDKTLTLRRGLCPALIWKRGVQVSATAVSPSDDTPLSLLVRPDRHTTLLRFLERYAHDRAVEKDVRAALVKEGKGEQAGAVQVCNVDVPASPWTDRMLALQLQRELLAEVEAAHASATQARPRPSQSPGGSAAVTRKEESTSSLADILLFGTCALHFPTFAQPILYEEALYTSPGMGESAVQAQGGLAPPDDIPGLGVDPQASRMPPLLLQPTAQGALALTGEDSKEVHDASGRAYWGEQLSIIWDPEAAAGLDNPSDTKYHKLVRGGMAGAEARSIKPTRAELSKIQAIISAPDPTGIGAKPSQEAADLLWRCRYSLLGNKRALVKFAQVVDWADEAEANEGAQLLASWAPIDTEDALRLLCPEFSSPILRAHAVSALRRTSDEEILLYLLQLVQALRYEPGLVAVVTGHGHGHGARLAVTVTAEEGGTKTATTTGAEAGAAQQPALSPPAAGASADVLAASPLATVLVDRAAGSTSVAIYLYWFLCVARDTSDPTGPVYALFAAVHRALVEKLQGTVQGEELQEQVATLSTLAKARVEATSNKKDSVKAKIEKLNQLLSEDGPYQDVVTMRRAGGLPLPCAPQVRVSGIVTGGCHMFKSALYPTVITFKVHPRAGIDWAGPTADAGVCGLTISAAARKAAQAYRASNGASGTGAGAMKTPVRLVQETSVSKLDPNLLSPQAGAGGQATELTLADIVNSAAAQAGEAAPATYKVIYKQGDDLRQDQLIIQLLRICDAQLKRVGLDLHLTPYSVIATGPEAGWMEMVLNSLPVSAVLENAAYRRTGNAVQAYLREKNPDEGVEYGIAPDAMDRYVKSCAGYAAITYILGIGDRHLDNIMLASDGRLFHLDFGYIFGRDPKPLPAPMRITKEMIDGMGGPASSNYDRFKKYCCSAYQILRRHASLITVLLTLMKDAGIPDLGSGTDASTVITKLHDKFRVDMADEAADGAILDLIDTSVSALAPAFFEVLHKIRVAMR